MRNAFKKKKRLNSNTTNPEIPEESTTATRINRMSLDWNICKREMDSNSPKLLLHRRVASPLFMMKSRSPIASPEKKSLTLTKVLEVARSVSQNLIETPLK